MKKVRYIIDGQSFHTLEEFYEHVTAVMIPAADWGKNLDAFNDILRGGFGTPETGFVIEWHHSKISRRRLGYNETIRQLENRLSQCHPTNRPVVRASLAKAKAKKGETVFDWLVEIIRIHGSQGRESQDHVDLELK